MGDLDFDAWSDATDGDTNNGSHVWVREGKKVFLTHTIVKNWGEMSICTILVQVLCNIYQIPLETVVMYFP